MHFYLRFSGPPSTSWICCIVGFAYLTFFICFYSRTWQRQWIICRHWSSCYCKWNISGFTFLHRTSRQRQANSACTMLLVEESLIRVALVWGIGLTSDAARTPFWAVRERNFLSALVLAKATGKFASRKTAQVSLIFLPSGHLSWFWLNISWNKHNAFLELFDLRFSIWPLMKLLN